MPPGLVRAGTHAFVARRGVSVLVQFEGTIADHSGPFRSRITRIAKIEQTAPLQPADECGVSRGSRRSLGWVPFKAANLKRKGRALLARYAWGACYAAA